MDPDMQFHLDGLNFTNIKAENGVVTLTESSFAHFQQILKYYMEQVFICYWRLYIDLNKNIFLLKTGNLVHYVILLLVWTTTSVTNCSM